LELAARIARLEEDEAQAACQCLLENRWIDSVDTAGTRFRVGAGSRASRRAESAAGALSRWHAETLAETFSNWRAQSALCKALLAEMDSAFQWALLFHWKLATALAHRAFAFLKSEGRFVEAIDLYKQVIRSARERNDHQEVEDCTWELSWIHDEGSGLRRSTENAQQMGFNFVEEPHAGDVTI
jgi:hypothetical protein